VATVDIPGAFLQTDAKPGTYMKITGPMVDILCQINQRLYEKYVKTEIRKRVLYTEASKSIYGMVDSAFLFWARSRWNHAQYPKYITGTDRHTIRAQTVSDWFKAFNARYAVEYLFFARILALCRPINVTNPIRQLYTSLYSAYSCLIGLVKLIGGHSAMNLAKSLIGSKKTIVFIAHLCSEMAVFGRNTIRFFQRSIQYSTTKHAVHSYLGYRTTAQTEYAMGCTVNNSLKL
jgi:hypothetical protein